MGNGQGTQATQPKPATPLEDFEKFQVAEKDDVKVTGAMSFSVHVEHSNISKIRFTKLSRMMEIEAIKHYPNGKFVPHFGVLIENNFVAYSKLDASERHSYKYMLVHAKVRRGNKEKVKFEICLSNTFGDLKKQFVSVFETSNPVVSPDDIKMGKFEISSQHANMQVIVNCFHNLIERKFDSHCMKDMAMQKYDCKINCIIAAKTFYAVSLNLNAHDYVEHWMQHYRGTLLKLGKMDVNSHGLVSIDKGIPNNGGKICFTTIKEYYCNESGILYKLQQYIGVNKSKKKLNTRLASDGKFTEHAIVHSKKYRINALPNGASDDNKSFNWRDIFHDDDFDTAKQMWHQLVPAANDELQFPQENDQLMVADTMAYRSLSSQQLSNPTDEVNQIEGQLQV